MMLSCTFTKQAAHKRFPYLNCVTELIIYIHMQMTDTCSRVWARNPQGNFNLSSFREYARFMYTTLNQSLCADVAVNGSIRL